METNNFLEKFEDLIDDGRIGLIDDGKILYALKFLMYLNYTHSLENVEK
jgi:hypothetical protein